MYRITALLAIVVLALNTSFSQKGYWGKSVDFGKPFIADINSTMNKVELGVGSNEKEYDLNPEEFKKKKYYLEANLGASIPIWAKEYKKNYGLAFSIPVHTQILFDFLEPSTAPIINTDYSFALMEVRFIKRFDVENRLRNVAIKFSPYYHQSSHLGDEIVLYRQAHGIAVRRVNVTYDYAELALTLNDPEGRSRQNHALRLGAMHLLKPDSGWYSSIRRIEVDSAVLLSAMRSPWEFYVQYQLTTGRYFLSSKNFQHIISVEVRNRELYGIPRHHFTEGGWEASHQKSSRSTTLNLYSVWRLKISDNDSYNRLGIGVRIYHGLNYHGQLRHLPRYSFIGLSILLD